MTRLHVHIDELVLHGFDAASRHGIGDAVQAELQRRFALQPSLFGPGASAASLSLDRLHTAPVTLAAHAQRDGHAIGGALHQSLSSCLATPAGASASGGGERS
ncbi:hypothetical protein [Dyella silvatica]|uniref:hypothetical protein n=1 Tax=Dyella silvatica TaxID=2992128 RepID=UPI0022593827|nr:hypothetical protein [Dyella silvatica]